MRDVLSVGKRKYPTTIGAVQLVSTRTKGGTKQTNTVIVYMNDSQSSHTALPLGHDHIDKVEFKSLDQVIVAERFAHGWLLDWKG